MHEFYKDECFYPFYPQPLISYDAYSPEISKFTMYFHHDKHYEGYVNKLNALLSINPILQNVSLVKLTQVKDPEIKTAAGGVLNHQLYFNSLSPVKIKPSDSLDSIFSAYFGSFENMLAEFKSTALELTGSGYAWLVESAANEKKDKELKIISTANQGTPDISFNKILLPIDVWEHAYYLDRQNRRDDYIDAFLKIVNWDMVELRLDNNL